MANSLVNDPKAAAAPPTDAQIRTELDAERAARRQAEQDLLQLQQAAHNEWRGRVQAENELKGLRQPRTDAFETLAQEGVAVDPEKQRQLLDRGVRERTREELSAYDRAQMQREQQRETQLALNMFAAQNPVIVGDEEGFYAAMGKAKYRSEKNRTQMNPWQLLEMGKSIYYEDRKGAPGAPGTVPYTEGAGYAAGPGGAVATPEESVRVKNMIEDYYGLKAGDIVSDDSMDDHTRDYIDKKNGDLEGQEKFHSGIRQIRATMIEGQQRRSNAGR